MPALVLALPVVPGRVCERLMSEHTLILGGGVAGLSAANRLAERGCRVTLVEANTYPQHKVCGEFLSPEALPILDAWSIPLGASITHATLTCGHGDMRFPFPTPAGSTSRYQLDSALAQRAVSLGATIRTGVHITATALRTDTKPTHRVELSSGEVLESDQLIIAIGRVLSDLLQRPPPVMRYVGFKAHFRTSRPTTQLDMICFQGGYLGISPVDSHTLNAACLVTAAQFAEAGCPDAILTQLQHDNPQNPSLASLTTEAKVFEHWLTTRVPPLRWQNPPASPHAYFLGDAMGGIYPATGDGLGMALTSGLMVADFVIDGDWIGYREAWRKRYIRRLRWGALIHQSMKSPAMARGMFHLCNLFPRIPARIFQETREPTGMMCVQTTHQDPC